MPGRKVALNEAEGDLSFTRLVQLIDHPPKATGDLDELRAIHRTLFQDVYDWAGKLRTVDMRKNAEGAQFFLPVSMIDRAVMFAEGELRGDNELRGMGRDQFIDRLAYHYDAFNYIHPFREGNGRTQRVFWNRVARDAEWQLDWRTVHGATNDQASDATSARCETCSTRSLRRPRRRLNATRRGVPLSAPGSRSRRPQRRRCASRRTDHRVGRRRALAPAPTSRG